MVKESIPGVGAVVGALERGTTLSRCSQTKEMWRRWASSSSVSRQLKLCLLEREKAGASKVFKIF
jgi:hypothetical protein